MERFAFLKQLAMKYARFPAEIMEDTLFSSVGMDSYDVVDFMLNVEEMFGITAGDDEILSVNCIRDVEELIAGSMLGGPLAELIIRNSPSRNDYLIREEI